MKGRSRIRSNMVKGSSSDFPDLGKLPSQQLGFQVSYTVAMSVCERAAQWEYACELLQALWISMIFSDLEEKLSSLKCMEHAFVYIYINMLER